MEIRLNILDADTGQYGFEKSVDIPFIPRVDEKFALQRKSGRNDMYQVVDVVYSVNRVEILLRELYTVNDYLTSTGLHVF